MELEETKPKILYVDDEEENLLVFKSSFRRYYDIVTANSAKEALALFDKEAADIIISDQRMPGMTGVEFIKSLPDEPDNLRMILTGYSDMEAIVSAINTGKLYRYITKPWKKENLMAEIDGALHILTEQRNRKQQIEDTEKKKQALEEALESNGNKNNENILQLELLKKEDENKKLRKLVEEGYKNVHLLSEVGQKIISNLTIDSIIESTYENVNALMDANSFGIGIFNPLEKRIEFNGWIEKNAKLPFHFANLSEERLASWCFRNQKEIFINDFQTEYNKYLKTISKPMAGDDPESILYLPLVINDIPIGVISTQSFKRNAYTNYHVNILRNISIYVATALENAKAYSLIEEQKTEIEKKNIELEEKVKQRTEQFQEKNDELEDTYSKLKLLSEIGQQITATLSLEKIIETVYANVNKLMDAPVFLIGIYNNAKKDIEVYGMEKGEKIPFIFIDVEEENRPAAWCFRNQQDFIINDYQKEYNKYIKNIPRPKAGELPESLLYLPLSTGEEHVGVISVQSFRKYIYNQYHIDILRSLGSYIITAIQNASSYKRMTEAFEQLKSTQTKLVESEKMASLGVLTAGVAHEINNPVNFISGGIQSLEENYADLQEFLQLMLQYYAEPSSEELRKTIDKKKKALQLDKLMPEIGELIVSIKNGADRTSEIVKGLRNFSRMDENDMKKADLEEGLDNTLVILNNQLKDRINVKKEYGKIPGIMCFPGQLNQVFMNILYNASDAIGHKGDIHIKTWQENGNIKISIKDNGKGMPESIRSRIFEPFFTTKDVGKGTGLGLSIAYGIIEKHKGHIEVQSEEGKGTTFTLTLPVQ